ncbi:actin-binding protein IPP isoform X2 [Solea solea]|uniref:actin-binding protein IPP isoform X2 n=1 Tax=Solea solea TaxID=90069 RepID=UPI00272ACFC3|nr:actin-binding protein IPP isoform X2 [Solea solea]
MNPFRQYLMVLFEWLSSWLKYGLTRLWRDVSSVNAKRRSSSADAEEWETDVALRTYRCGDGGETMVTVQTCTHTFHVDLERLSECSDYFRALSQSKMRETSESFIHLDHVSSSVFYNILEFSFHNKFKVPKEELDTHIQVGSYLLTVAFLSKCLSVLADELRPDNCLSYLSLAQEICCAELKMTVLTYLSRNMMELSLLTRQLKDEEKDEVIKLRTQGERHLCSVRKENLTTWSDPETERARHVFILKEGEGGESWCPVTELPFRADKWCFTAVVLYNYLYIIGGYRQRVRRGWEFKMASFRYNPTTHMWVSTAPLIKRRHFSAVACDGCVYAVGGWYLDSLVSPDSCTALYTAVECYDPWQDTWRFVSSLPLTDFQFSVSLSHDVPLLTCLGHCVYVLGSIQRTGEKLLLQYDTRQDSWSELLPTLTRADTDLPTLYFLCATDELLVIGGNASENVVTSFCVQSHKWGQVHWAEKVAFAGQGTVADNKVLIPSVEHNTVAEIDLQTLSLRAFPPLPVSVRYEATFHLHF